MEIIANHLGYRLGRWREREREKEREKGMGDQIFYLKLDKMALSYHLQVVLSLENILKFYAISAFQICN
jgi:hypothetical protein